MAETNQIGFDLENYKSNRVSQYKTFRDDYSNEIPTVVQKSAYQFTHKVAKNWWQLLITNIGLDLRFGLVNEENFEEIKKFYQKYGNNSPDDNKLGSLTSREAIDEANNILDLLIGDKKQVESSPKPVQ